MTQNVKFPLRLTHSFFKSLNFSRASELPEPLKVEIMAEIKVRHRNFPDQLQIDLKLETAEGQPLMFCIELVGLFNLVEDQPRPSREILPDFVNQRALHMLWPYVAQMIRIVTGQMGMNPVTIPIPHYFEFSPADELVEAQESAE